MFEFYIPEQEALENATLEIGTFIFENVDFGEVWIAGGQSNMEFLLKFDAEGEREIAHANDDHLRMYDVAKYAFEGEREEQYKDETYWERWMTFCPQNVPEFSAVGLYFARELRTMGIPVT